MIPDSTNVRVIADNIRSLKNQSGADETRIAALETAVAAIPIGKIPKDYSETETDTGVKWIDGRSIYSRGLSGSFGVISASATQQIGTIEGIDIIDNISVCRTADNSSESVNRFQLTYIYGTGAVNLLAIVPAYSEGTYVVVIYYVKTPSPTPGNREPDEEPDQEPEVKKTTKRKTTKGEN